jgi:hypothetical protein
VYCKPDTLFWQPRYCDVLPRAAISGRSVAMMMIQFRYYTASHGIRSQSCELHGTSDPTKVTNPELCISPAFLDPASITAAFTIQAYLTYLKLTPVKTSRCYRMPEILITVKALNCNLKYRQVRGYKVNLWPKFQWYTYH